MFNTPVFYLAIPPQLSFPLKKWGISVLCLSLIGCGSTQVKTSAPNVKPSPLQHSNLSAANSVLIRALGLVGTPYKYGGNTPESGFDCSGLVNYVYKEMLNIRLPRTSRELSQMQTAPIPQPQLSTGDLVFFGSKGQVSHVGIYVGDGRFVHAPSTGGRVRMDYLNSTYWKEKYAGAKRILTN